MAAVCGSLLEVAGGTHGGADGDMLGKAVLQSVQMCQFLGVRLNFLADGGDDGAALHRGFLGPHGKRPAGSCNSLVHVGLVGQRDGAERFACRHVDGGERFSGFGVDPCAVDPHFKITVKH